MTENDLKTTEELIRALNHEIRNPLTALKGFVQLLEVKKQDPDKISGYCEIMLRQISAIEEIFDNLYSYFDTGINEFSEISLNDLVIELQTQKKSLKLITPDDDIFLKTDVFLFKKIIFLLTDLNEVYEKTEIQFITEKTEIKIFYRNIDFFSLNSSNFFLPYAAAVFFRDGSSLFNALQIASKLNMELRFDKEKNMVSVKFPNV
ncbi:MAG: hypothetical protein JW982_05210 [Spirochaetes bacterium]|nr:hypothetical protein [Spirochaetota bacterium]